MLKAFYYKMVKNICVIGKDHELEICKYMIERELEKRSVRVYKNDRIDEESEKLFV